MFLKEAGSLHRDRLGKQCLMLGYAEQWKPQRSQDFWIPLAFYILPFPFLFFHNSLF